MDVKKEKVMSGISTVSASIMYDYKVINTARNYTWLADEPLELGGQDEGPLPIELFLSSIASSILITNVCTAPKLGCWRNSHRT